MIPNGGGRKVQYGKSRVNNDIGYVYALFAFTIGITSLV